VTRRTEWPVREDSGGPTSSRAETGSPRSPGGKRRRDALRGADERDYGGGEDSGEGWDGSWYAGREGGTEVDGEGGHGGSGGRRSRGAGSGGLGRGRGRKYDAGPGEDGDTAGEAAEAAEGDPAERARTICLRLLTGMPRTRRQLADALSKREIPEDVAEEVLSRFEGVGLIDDAAFADAWVESRHHSRGLARRALARELRTKGVDSVVIDDAVGQLDSEQERETARALVERKLRATRGLAQEKRIRRLAGMLARKGYTEGVALRVVRQALEEEGEDPELLEQHLPDG
jgi:regulatory protein